MENVSFLYLRMWTSFEIEKVQEMYANLEKESLEDFLPPNLIDVIANHGDMVYQNLRYTVYRIQYFK